MRILYFWAPGCSICRSLAPRLDEAEASYQATIERIDATRSPDLTRRYSIRGTPTLIAITEDGHEVARITGKPGPDALQALFKADAEGAALPPSREDLFIRAGAGLALFALGLLTGPSWPLVAIGAAVTLWGTRSRVQTDR